jgi:hypothetical protein
MNVIIARHARKSVKSPKGNVHIEDATNSAILFHGSSATIGHEVTKVALPFIGRKRIALKAIRTQERISTYDRTVRDVVVNVAARMIVIGRK